MKSKVALALLVLAASIVLSACGGSGEDGLASSTPTAPRGLRDGRPPRTDPTKSCDKQGVNSTQLFPGACTEAGVRYVVANYGGLVRLGTLAVTIVEIGVAPGYQSPTSTIAPRLDAFLRVKLQVQNRDRVAHRFDFGQTMLGIGSSNYLERIDVERRYHPESIARSNGGKVGPGETLIGDVVFDINQTDYQQLQQKGRFFIWNFGEKAAPEIARGAQVGQIRLYAGEPSQQQG